MNAVIRKIAKKSTKFCWTLQANGSIINPIYLNAAETVRERKRVGRLPALFYEGSERHGTVDPYSDAYGGNHRRVDDRP